MVQLGRRALAILEVQNSLNLKIVPWKWKNNGKTPQFVFPLTGIEFIISLQKMEDKLLLPSEFEK